MTAKQLLKRATAALGIAGAIGSAFVAGRRSAPAVPVELRPSDYPGWVEVW